MEINIVTPYKVQMCSEVGLQIEFDQADRIVNVREASIMKFLKYFPKVYTCLNKHTLSIHARCVSWYRSYWQNILHHNCLENWFIKFIPSGRIMLLTRENTIT